MNLYESEFKEGQVGAIKASGTRLWSDKNSSRYHCLIEMAETSLLL